MAILSFPSQAARGVGALTWRGRNVARGGLGLGGGLGKEQELHVDLYLVWGRSRGYTWISTWFGEGAGGLCGFVPGLEKEQGVHVGLYLVWGREMPSCCSGAAEVLAGPGVLLWGSCGLGLRTDTGRAT